MSMCRSYMLWQHFRIRQVVFRMLLSPLRTTFPRILAGSHLLTVPNHYTCLSSASSVGLYNPALSTFTLSGFKVATPHAYLTPFTCVTVCFLLWSLCTLAIWKTKKGLTKLSSVACIIAKLLMLTLPPLLNILQSLSSVPLLIKAFCDLPLTWLFPVCVADIYFLKCYHQGLKLTPAKCG